MTRQSYVDGIKARALTAESRIQRMAYDMRTHALTAAFIYVTDTYPEMRELQDQLDLADCIAESSLKLALKSLQLEPTEILRSLVLCK